MNIKRLSIAILILIIFLFHFINNILWLQQDGNQALGCESVFHLERAFEIYNHVKDSSSNYLESLISIKNYPWVSQIRQISVSNIPSAFAAIGTFLTILFNLPFLNLPLTNTIYLLPIIVFTYLVGKITRNKKTGLLAAFLVSFYPMIYGISRKAAPEIALTAIVSCAYYFLIKTNNLKSILYSLLTAITCFLGIIIQPLFIAFISPGLIHHFYKILRYRDKNIGQKLLNLCICIIIIVMALFFTYNDNHKFASVVTDTLKQMHITLTTHSENFVGNADKAKDELFIFASPNDPCPCTQSADRGMNLKCFLFYPVQLIYNISPFYTILFIIGVFFFIKDKKSRNKSLLFIWTILPYLFLTLLERKWGRFYTPAFPAIAVITACGIVNIRNKQIKKIILILIFIAAFMQFFIYSYHTTPNKPPLSVLTEYMNAHKPLPTNYKLSANKIMQTIKINNAHTKKLEIGLFDIVKSANRFSCHWYNDLTYYFRLLLNFYKKTPAQIALHWNISASLLDKSNYDFLIILKDPDYNLDASLIQSYALLHENILTPANILVLTYKKKF